MEKSSTTVKSVVSCWGVAIVSCVLFTLTCTVGDRVSDVYGFGGPPTPAGAQERGHKPPKEPTVEMIMEMLKNELELSDGQVADIRPAFSDLLKKEKELKEKMHQEMKENMDAMQQAQADLRKETLAEVSSFISEDQAAKLEEILNHPAPRQKRPGHHPPQSME